MLEVAICSAVCRATLAVVLAAKTAVEFLQNDEGVLKLKVVVNLVVE